MTKNQKEIHKLLMDADACLGMALRLNKGKNKMLSRKIVESQLTIDDATVYLDSRQTLLEK